MLSKCANPDCSARFQYLREGKLFQFDSAAAGPRPVSEAKVQHKIEYFWLCDDCAGKLTLSFHRGKGVIAVPLHGPLQRRAAAS